MDIITDTNARRRFYSYIPDFPSWGVDKVVKKPIPKMEALAFGNYIQLPTQKSKYITLDLDYEEAGAAWIAEDLPCPTIIIVNPDNGHAHYLYELKNQIVFPITNSSIKISWKAINYYRAVRKGYSIAFNSDLGYSGYTVKNPFSTKWRTFWHDYQYDLDTLAKYIDLPDLYSQKIEVETDVTGRHVTMFNSCRKIAYKIVANFSTFDDFYDKVLQLCMNFYEENIKPIQSDHSFTENEAKSIATSIAKWTWNAKSKKNFKSLSKNRGVMKFLSANEIGQKLDENEIKFRESEGAKYTHKIKQTKSLEIIKNTIKDLESKNLPVTLNSVWANSNLSKNTVKKYRDIFCF